MSLVQYISNKRHTIDNFIIFILIYCVLVAQRLKCYWKANQQKEYINVTRSHY